MNMNKNIAFTIAEIIIVFTVIGILSLFIIQSINDPSDSKKKMMFKKAYSTAERLVYDIVNDEDLYPAISTTTTEIGFRNTNAVAYNGDSYSGSTKLCKLFAAKLNTISKTDNCKANSNYTNNKTCEKVCSKVSGVETCKKYCAYKQSFSDVSFITNDGINWYIPNINFTAGDEITNFYIMVDVNGTAKPNCEFNTDTCKLPDRFRIGVTTEGKMFVEGDKEKEYLEANGSN